MSINTSALLERLQSRLPPGLNLLTTPDQVMAYERDQCPWARPGRALAVARPESTGQVAALLAAAQSCSVPVVPRGAGSGLSGGATALEGGIILSLERMNQILDISVDDMRAVVQPGVITADVKQRAADLGLFYAPDPASAAFSTIGGNAATNAGGLCCVAYGTTRDSVLALELVLADGTVTRVGSPLLKDVAELDLTSLIVGSEGTLAVITELTLRLRPTPPRGGLVVAYAVSSAAAADAVTEALRRATPTMLELMDATTIRAVSDYARMELDADAAALLLVQHAGPAADLEQILASVEGINDVIATDDPQEMEMLTHARRSAYPALEQLGSTVLDDVGVLPSRLPQLLSGIEEIAAANQLVIGVFGHAGDGNLHPTIVFARDDEAARTRAQKAFDQIVMLATDLGGTATGEHGVGTLKRTHVSAQLDPTTARLQRQIKSVFDPHGILNPERALA